MFESFLDEHPEYASTKMLDDIRANDFDRLDEQDHIYLDFTGGHLYPNQLIAWHQDFLKANILGNPHSQNPSSSLSESYLNASRRKVLDFFNCEDDYLCIFTSNATAAIKILGECYPFEKNGQLLLLADNHNSINGLREYAQQKNAPYQYVDLSNKTLCINEDQLWDNLQQFNHDNRLFAFPAQSNVSGVKHDLSWIGKAQKMGWDVLLDAAAFVPTNKLDLQQYQPEFVCISFYKMFGYPTGLGCLLVKKSSYEKLQKPSFSGGTITIVSVKGDGYHLESHEARFEDGTVDYLSIPAISKGLEYIESIGFNTIQKRIRTLIRFLIDQLNEIAHSNNRKLVTIYGPDNHELRGNTITMNFFDCNGELYDFSIIERLAGEWNISLRTGCFCNPGIDESNHDLSGEKLRAYFSNDGEKDYFDLIQFLGKKRGAVRISVGYISNFNDAYRFIHFCEQFLDLPKSRFA